MKNILVLIVHSFVSLEDKQFGAMNQQGYTFQSNEECM